MKKKAKTSKVKQTRRVCVCVRVRVRACEVPCPLTRWDSSTVKYVYGGWRSRLCHWACADIPTCRGQGLARSKVMVSAIGKDAFHIAPHPIFLVAGL